VYKALTAATRGRARRIADGGAAPSRERFDRYAERWLTEYQGRSSRPISARTRERYEVGGAATHRVKRPGDPTSDELVVARRLWALASLQVTLALLAGVVPGLSRGESSADTWGLPPRGEHL
jgi:hypothetical protein